jgi:hypothetical protein
MPGPGPAPDAKRATDPESSLRFRIPGNAQITHLLIFRSIQTDASPAAQLLRVPNRPDLAPAGNIRLRLDDNSVIAPSVVPLSTLEHDAQGWSVLVEPEQPQTGPVRVWLSTVTVDGMPCPPSGPWRILFTVPPPPAPTLAAHIVPAGLHFQWTWPGAENTPLVVERSADGNTWQRISPLLGTTHTSFEAAKTATPMRYRLNLRTPAQQLVVSNVVTA